jgi:stress response protein YsnF
MKTIIAAFCDSASAQQALNFVQSRGLNDAQMLTHSSGLTNRLSGFNIPEDKIGIYAEAMRRGSPVLVAHAEDDNARDIARQLDAMGSIDLDAASTRWRKDGWTDYDERSRPYDAQQSASEQQYLRQESNIDDRMGRQGAMGSTMEGDRDLEVIEEKVNVGKRAVERGGVRVRTFIVERPVNEQVELREERIDVTREPVNERVSPGALDSTLTEDEFVVTAQGEEAVVGKEARVVERVHVGKVAEVRTETIQETERRQDVEVEQIEGARLTEEELRSRR